MVKNSIFIFSHQDDEFGLYNIIEKQIEEKKNIIIIYLTSGYNISINKFRFSKRDKESLMVLLNLGVKKKNIYFIGRKLNIKIYDLYKHLNIVYNHVNLIIKKLKNKSLIFTHAWEGGNEDHDACYVIVKKIILKNKNILSYYQFSQYHGHKTFFLPFKIQEHFQSNTKLFHIKINFTKKIKYIRYLFSYVSQKYLWLPVYPFIILKILSNNYGKLIEIDKNSLVKKPHKGKLLYEKMRKNKFTKLNKFFQNFLKK